MKTLTGGPLGPMIERPGSPGAPYRQKERQEETVMTRYDGEEISL